MFFIKDVADNRYRVNVPCNPELLPKSLSIVGWKFLQFFSFIDADELLLCMLILILFSSR